MIRIYFYFTPKRIHHASFSHIVVLDDRLDTTLYPHASVAMENFIRTAVSVDPERDRTILLDIRRMDVSHSLPLAVRLDQIKPPVSKPYPILQHQPTRGAGYYNSLDNFRQDSLTLCRYQMKSTMDSTFAFR